MATRLADPPAPPRPRRAPRPPTPGREGSSIEALFGVSLAATLFMLGLPGATVALLVRLGGPSFSGVSGWAVTVAVSVGYMALGSKLWRRHPRAQALSFGELVLWSWAR